MPDWDVLQTGIAFWAALGGWLALVGLIAAAGCKESLVEVAGSPSRQVCGRSWNSPQIWRFRGLLRILWSAAWRVAALPTAKSLEN